MFSAYIHCFGRHLYRPNILLRHFIRDVLNLLPWILRLALWPSIMLDQAGARWWKHILIPMWQKPGVSTSFVNKVPDQLVASYVLESLAVFFRCRYVSSHCSISDQLILWQAIATSTVEHVQVDSRMGRGKAPSMALEEAHKLCIVSVCRVRFCSKAFVTLCRQCPSETPSNAVAVVGGHV